MRGLRSLVWVSVCDEVMMTVLDDDDDDNRCRMYDV